MKGLPCPKHMFRPMLIAPPGGIQTGLKSHSASSGKSVFGGSRPGFSLTVNTGSGSTAESCSCLEGNPCVDEYHCKDWNNRFDVARKNGWVEGRA